MSTVVSRGQSVLNQEFVTVDDGKEAFASSTPLPESPPLGVPLQHKRFFWQRSKLYDPDAIATLPSVYDDPETAKNYEPRADW